MKSWMIGATAAFGLFAVATAAGAAPAAMTPGQSQAAGSATLIEQVHGCHRGAQDGLGGWHRHVGSSCRRVDSSPDWQDPYSRCRTKCRYVGPIKQCRRICY